jgi:hypothetical protein
VLRRPYVEQRLVRFLDRRAAEGGNDLLGELAAEIQRQRTRIINTSPRKID